MSEVEKLDQQIAELQQQIADAETEAAKARTEYAQAIADGDLDGAQQALQREQAAGEARPYRDRIECLEGTRKDAERTDRTPAAMEAMDEARTAVDAEGKAYRRFSAALAELSGATDALRAAFRATDEALDAADAALQHAHLIEQGGVERPLLAVDVEAARELALSGLHVKQGRDGIQRFNRAEVASPKWTPPPVEDDTPDDEPANTIGHRAGRFWDIVQNRFVEH